MTIIAKGRAKGFGSFPGYIKDEIQAIAEAFSDYEFDDQEKGLYYLCKRIFKTRYSKRLASVIRGQKSELYVQQHYGVDRIYPRYHKRNGDSGCHKISKDYFRAGKPIEKRFEKSGYVQIKMLAVKKEYRGQGYMRKMVRSAFDLADELKVPCIVSTDAKSKADRYKHLGFELYQIRKISDHSVEYDMVRCFGNNNQTVI